ncbi:3968_t:CDS:10 [Acaulospora colombiana]|uniref:3968_t:CDS:1 n=1 Tax=Acaulospora colombiana TaxID=27376 RepID=A0ACA9M450_9GLOM|nr:3968_t:CDS:10 [Acaulospora colombiana]
MPRRGYIEDDLDSSNESEGEPFTISNTLLAEEAELFENPTYHRKRRKITKEEAYLGIWAEDEEDIGTYEKKSDVQFVSSSSKPVSEKAKEEPLSEDTDKDSSDNLSEINDSRPGGQGLGFGSPKIDVEDESLGTGLGYGRNSESTILDEMLDMQFSSTKNKRKTWTNSRQSASSQETLKQSRSVDKNFGKFEQHTRGIGLKLMQKMGYKLGEGLGVDNKGIVNPIETKIRPSKMGLAYRGFGEKTEQSKNEGKNIVEKDHYEKVQKEKKNAWKKTTKPKKSKTEYKTVDEIMSETALDTPVQPMKIIDMTGPQARELSSASQITSHSILDDSSRFPELRHNLRLIVDMSKSDLEHFTRERRIQNERKKSLEQEIVRFSTLVEKETTSISRLGEIMAIIKDCNELLTVSLSSESPELRIFSDLFRKLQTEYLDDELTMTPYENMMYNVWLPKVRSAINNSWNARDFDSAIRLLEDWHSLLPVFIRENIINQLIMPKLTYEIDMWNPKTDTGMIHQWLHPWLPLLGERMDPLYVTVRQKFGLILQNWDPTDPRALAILKPWKNVLQPIDMQSLLAKSILPKLSELIRSRFQINPRKQELGLFNCVMKWQHMFASNVFNKLFESEFFPKWLDVLYTWLKNNPKYDEIRQWYMFWKSMFPPDMRTEQVIEAQFAKGLSLIEESISLGKESTSRLSHPSRQQSPTIEPSQSSSTKTTRTFDSEEITFFEIVEEFAQENNLLFLLTNKTHKLSGKPIYRMGGTPEGAGGVTMYLQDDVMFVKSGQDWLPMGFDEILDMCLT